MEGFGRFLLDLCVLCLIVGGLIVGAFWYYYSKDKEPTALDVYRGRTELVVTSRNGVPVDSVVVFKAE